jgi:hypothetical protein
MRRLDLVALPVGLVVGLVAGLVVAGCSAGSPSSPEERSRAIADQLGDGWDAEVVDDPRDGSFVLARPTHAAVWTVGAPVEEVADLTQDTAWGDFWVPALRSATADSNIRAVVADATTLPDTVVSWQVNVNRADRGLALGLEELAVDLRDRFAAQGLEVNEARVVSWHDRDVALVAFTVPAEVFGDEARYVRQWFIPASSPEAMWSFSCDAPADPELSAELCRTGLEGFRVPDATEGSAT